MQCSRCEESSVTRTRGENFCESCYHEFLTKKVRALMGHFRVFGSTSAKPPKILICLSFGPSSLALIDLLLDIQQSQKAKHNGMVGFTLECVHFGTNPAPENWPWPEINLKRLPNPKLPAEDAEKPLTRSAKHDLQGILYRRAGLDLANKLDATAAFGYSMTKLSELTLAETVKGRGSSIPSLVSPDLIKDRTFYPVREITLPELEAYCQIRGLDKLIIPEPTVPGITKMQSIDEIVRQYFADVRKGFPSVVSTVSKVASRLSQDPEPCALCQTPSSQAYASGEPRPTELCYACRSSLGEPRLSSPLDVLKEYEL